jgi:hypothetical protein
MTIERDNHGRLLQLVYDYIKANLLLEERPSLNKTIEVRKILSDIKRCALVRREEVMAVQKQRRAFLDERKGKSDSTEAEGTDD